MPVRCPVIEWRHVEPNMECFVAEDQHDNMVRHQRRQVLSFGLQHLHGYEQESRPTSLQKQAVQHWNPGTLGCSLER